MEALKRTGHLTISMEDFRGACRTAGLPSAPSLDEKAESELVLRFFGRLGLILNHSAAPDLVILRPAEFLFPYLTRIICDFRVHSALIPEHDDARSLLPRDFRVLQTRGVLSVRLLAVLWGTRQHQAEVR